jgi:acetylornithine deacetylase
VSVVELTSELVALNTVNPALVDGAPGERAAVELLASRLSSDFDVRVIGDERPSLLASRISGRGRVLALNGHLDTVGAGEMVDPFSPRIEGDRLYGRGSCDMKAGVAALVVAAEQSEGDVVLALVADEEHGSLGTTAVLAELDGVDACIVAEPTWNDLAVSHRGFAVIEVELRGRAAHSSRPAEGVNAIEHLGALIHSLEPPLMATVARGGIAPFVIPDRACVTIERRTDPGEHSSLALEEVRALTAGFDATCTVTMAREAWALQPQPLLPLFDEHLAPGRFNAPYWMESALWQDAGIPTVVCGPAGGGLHEDVEWVELSQLRAYTEALTRIIPAFCRPA